MRFRGIFRLRTNPSRLFLFSIFVLTVIIYCYYCTTSSPVTKSTLREEASQPTSSFRGWMEEAPLFILNKRAKHSKPKLNLPTCSMLNESETDIDTVAVFPTLDFVPSWMRSKEYWDNTFEIRYENYKNDTSRPKLKVILVPHSHNDPGWLTTFEGYFKDKTKNIIDNAIVKMTQYPNMTFMWTEIAFLNAWWESSHPTKQKALKKLITDGRIEITTGGWVMADEANTHIYSLVDQLIEGHSWVKSTLGVTPKTGWSIDPFGHGPTVPYLLDQSGFEGAIIQRIHYAWKRWFAERQSGDFHWIPGWSAKKKTSLIVHNQPFDIYSIKGSCGPHPSVCLRFDFRLIPNEYTETSDKHEDITDKNVHSKSKLLMEEYNRIGSLTTHNVVLVPLGDDFRYERDIEWDSQYLNYYKLFTYINSHPEIFNADVQFGTPLDYFNELKSRQKTMPTLKGDFFVYSDIFSEGTPAYWSGYFTTRPYLKILARQLEHNLRSAEILYTLVLNHIKQKKPAAVISRFRGLKRMEKYFDQLMNARRNMGLFQHHDAITGTSKSVVMADYGAKLFSSLYSSVRIQETALSILMIADPIEQNVLQSETQWDTYGHQPEKVKILVKEKRRIVLFNSLNDERTEVITIVSNSSNVKVFDNSRAEYVACQINPHVDAKRDGRHVIMNDSFDVLFVARLPPLSAVTYTVEDHHGPKEGRLTTIYCTNCNTTLWKKEDVHKKFVLTKMMPGDIQLENNLIKLLINRQTGFIKHIYRKDINKKHAIGLELGAYQSAQRHSGAYLFMPDYETPEKNVLNEYANWESMPDENIVIVSGPIATEITTLYLPFLVHTVRIFNVDDPILSEAIYIENIVDFGIPPSNRETELFMRLQTNIQNKEPPEFYTDQNGFQYQKRKKVDLGIEANYYPITTMAWIQDDETRISLLTDHAQGASAFEPGRLEIMLDRRMLYDDYRGMGEGVIDNKLTVFQNWLLIESVHKSKEKNTDSPGVRTFNVKQQNAYELPSHKATYLSRSMNYPINTFVLEETEGTGSMSIHSRRVLVENFPRDVHLMSLRTIADDVLDQFPSSACHMILHRPASSCLVGDTLPSASPNVFTDDSSFKDLYIRNVTATSLTGLHQYKHLEGLSDIDVDPMEIKTFKLTF